MSEYLEFKDEEIPEKNPNPKNDIYRVNGASGDDKIMIGGVVFAIFCIIVGVSFRDKTTLTLSLIFGGLVMYICIYLFYVKHFLRKKAIKNGKAYPAVIKRSFSYEKRRGTTYASSIHYTMYGIEVIYRNGTREFKGYDVDAKKIFREFLLYCL